MADLTPPERQLRLLMRIWTGLFGAGALAFWMAPNLVTGFLTLPPSSERFWNALAVSMMGTITYLSYQAQKEIQKARRLIRAVLVAKAVSTIAFTAALWTDRPSLAYLAGGILCDGPIFVITFLMYRRVFKKTP